MILVGAWLDWFRPDREFGPAFGLNAYDVPVKFLFRDTGLFLNRGAPTIGWLLLLVGLACVVAALARGLRPRVRGDGRAGKRSRSRWEGSPPRPAAS